MIAKNSSRYFLIIAVIAAAIAFSSCSQKKQTGISSDIVDNPATADSTRKSDANTPVFAFEVESHDFGKIKQGDKVSYNFKFKNSGGSDLVIASAHASCGCTVPEYPKQPVPPGKDGNLTVTFDSSGKSGKVTKTVTILANTIPNTKVVTITADIQVPEEK